MVLALLGQIAGAAPTKPPPAPVAPAPVPVITGPRYYFTIDLDCRYQIVGRGELTEEAAATANCYRFSTNASGKLLEIAYRHAGVPRPDPLFGVATINFESQPGIERRWYFDGHGQPTTDIDGIQGEELTLNAAGYPTDVTNLTASGARQRDSSGVAHYLRTLDNFNRLVTGRRIGLFGTTITDDNGYYETRTLYDNESRGMVYGNYDSSGNPLANKDGVATVRTAYTVDPDTTEIDKAYFDANGLAVAEKSSGVHEVRRALDNRGFLLDEAYFDLTGAPCLDTDAEIHERRFTWDERGNKTSEAFFDVDGNPLEEKSLGYAKVLYHYDDKNRVDEIAWFGGDGGPEIVPGIGAAMIHQEYDADGTIVRQQFFDGLGHPTPSAKYGSPAIRISVIGDRTIITLRDAHDHLMRNPISRFATISYKTDSDKPLTRTNLYYDQYGFPLSYFPRVTVINPHLYAMREEARKIAESGSHAIPMQSSARYGAGAAGIGALLGFVLTLRKSSYTRRRKIYIPSRMERLLGWLSSFAIIEGTLRFFLTVYWWWLDHQYARLGYGIYVVESVVVLFFLVRLIRLRVTMRVLNIEKEHVHRLVRAFYEKAKLKPDWQERRDTYISGPLDVRIRYFQAKYHAYLAFRRRGREGSDLARALAQYLRAQVRGVQAPVRRTTIALYYPTVALSYLLLSGTAFYTLWQLVKRY